MIITNCPKCGSMNITTAGVCANCGWSQFAKSTVSTGVYNTIGEIEIMLSGKALSDDYKRLLLENRNLKERVAELEVENKALRKQLWFSVCLKNVIQKETNAIRMSINKANNIASEER